MTHTPGPWAAECDDSGDDFSLSSGDKRIIGGCGCCGSPWLGGDDKRADMALIQAAPDLLEALRQVRRWMDARAFDAGAPSEVNILGWVNRAINKAEGR